MIPHVPNPDSFQGSGGEPFDDKAYREGLLRADLARIAIELDYRHGARLIDRLLADYTITPKRKFGERHG